MIIHSDVINSEQSDYTIEESCLVCHDKLEEDDVVNFKVWS